MSCCRFLITCCLTFASGLAVAHDSPIHHPETYSDLAHFVVHLLIMLPIAVGILSLIWVGKSYLVKLVDPSNRD